MYIINDIIDKGLEGKKKWKSYAHKSVAITVCIDNPNVKNMDTLKNNVKVINSIPKARIKKVTLADVKKLGVVA